MIWTHRTPLVAGLVLVVAIIIGTLTAEAQDASAPSKPIFATNYHVHGLLSLPYAELNEPFSAYYDKELDRSRTDYYGDEYQVYQFGPKSSPAVPNGSPYGSVYQFVYVPAGLHSSAGESRVHKLLDKAIEKFPFRRHDIVGKQQANTDASTTKTAVKRVCFAVAGGVGYTVSAQSVLPDLSEFTYDSTGRCPHVSGEEHHKASCELWKQSTVVGEKKNVYKFWLKRDQQNSSLAIPVHYYMLGYDTLLGSHYDRYDISYFKYTVGGARDQDFKLDVNGNKCGPMPGPGDSANDGERRAQMVVHNPIHQYVVEPHRYDHIDHHFEQFKSKYESMIRGKYEDEQQERKGWFNFMHNLRFIHGHNRQLKTFKLAVNQYADEDVANLRYLRGRIHKKGGYNGGLDYAKHHPGLKSTKGGLTDDLPESFDWTVQGAVTPVKDQAICGSCWSFGTSGTVEGAYFVKTGKLLRLSQQQLVDCSWEFGNNGCDGGEDTRAYGYIMKAGGLSTEEDYGHYKAIDGKCHDKDVERPVKIKGFYNVTTYSVDALKHALVNYGPVSISIDASPRTFSFYSHGAYYDKKCSNSEDSLDHSVLAVGYTKLGGKLVWKVKNSWSTYWGNDGYIFISAEDNNCGVLDAPTVPIIDVPGVDTTH